MNELPSYRELPAAARGGRSAWGLFGPGDNLGLVNLLTPDRIVAAAGLIRTGRMFPLDVPLGTISPALAGSRGTPRHTLLHRPGAQGFDDVYDNFYPQASSQWDSLGHVAYARDEFYNGATEADVQSGNRNTIEHWAQHGIAGRAVLLDVPLAMAEAGRPYDPGDSVAIGVEELELARRRAGVEFATGDIILLRTGFAEWYVVQSQVAKIRMSGNVRAPGLAHTEAVCEYLWDAHAVAIASDTFAVEVYPADFSPDAQPMGFLHHMLIGQFGMALGELWWLRHLAEDCAADGIYESFLVSVPLNAPGGIGSTANAIAIK
jgi:Putative cyclase